MQSATRIKKGKIEKVITILKKTYPNARCTLNYKTPIELLVATILSAQCTDERVNKLTPPLFSKYRKAEDFAEAPLSDLKRYIKSAGFYNTKARYIKEACRIIHQKYGGKLPNQMKQLLELPGVGRKTANILLGNIYGIHEGIPIDTHAYRISRRLGWTVKNSPEAIEFDLMKIIPKKYWLKISDLFVHHGRAICKAKKPACSRCPISAYCPKIGVKRVAK
ncbi:MAG: endonuclease III [Candidatus Micrarchaeota archaeon]|nr:endonuclease III [Candidatus Micrarchaeota archaeon]